MLKRKIIDFKQNVLDNKKGGITSQINFFWGQHNLNTKPGMRRKLLFNITHEYKYEKSKQVLENQTSNISKG